jgi:hypothetical protein
MVKEIRIYIEGGGDSKNQRSSLRKGFSKFFLKLVKEATTKKEHKPTPSCLPETDFFSIFFIISN